MTADFAAALAAERNLLVRRLAAIDAALSLYDPAAPPVPTVPAQHPLPAEPEGRADPTPPDEEQPAPPKCRLVTPVAVSLNPPAPGGEPPKPKGKRGGAWTPERRAEQAARARRMQAAKRQGKPNWGYAGGSAHTTEARGETTTYEEDGRTVTVCPPGFAVGSTRGVLGDL